MKKRYAWDLETDGLLSSVSTVHFLGIKDIDTHERWSYRKHPDIQGVAFDGTPYECGAQDTIAEGLDRLAMADEHIGHNLINYDLEVLRKLYPGWEPKPGSKVMDTLVLAQLIMPDTKPLDYKLIKLGKNFPGALIGKHKLEAWGYRISALTGKTILKGDYSEECKRRGINPWAQWNPDMHSYGEDDVDVTGALFHFLLPDIPQGYAVEFETACAGLATKVRGNGFPFDHAAALTLQEKLQVEQTKYTAEVKKTYGFWFAPDKKLLCRPIFDDPDIKDRPTPLSRALKAAEKKGEQVDRTRYQLNGYLRLDPMEGDESRPLWAEVTWPKRRRSQTVLNDDGSTRTVTYDPDTPYCKIKRIDFNPGSRDQIADRLVQMHAWTPVDFTETGKAEINDDVLTKLKDTIPEAAAFADIFFYNKILGQLSSGKNSWLNTYNQITGAIHGSINTGGTVSGRCSHSEPNLGQVPSVVDTEPERKDGSFDARCVNKDGGLLPWCFNADGTIKKKVYIPGRAGDFGIECRSLFHVPRFIDGVSWSQIGCDLKNIEARALAAVFSPYDDGELIDVLTIQGIDLHTYNMKATGITNRGLIKRVFFGLIYGAGDLKLGATAEPYWSEVRQRRLGGELRDTIMRGIPALKKASDAIKQQAKRGYLIGLDGRRLQVRAEYAALNLRLQSDAGLIAKKWWLLTEEHLLAAGGNHGWNGDFAMMAFVHDEQQIGIKTAAVEEGARIMCAAAVEAGEFFKFPCPVAAEAKIGQDWSSCH